MIMPNKVIPLEDSSLFKATKLLEYLMSCDDAPTVEAAQKSAQLNISEFIDALDFLFILNKLTVDKFSGVILLA